MDTILLTKPHSPHHKFLTIISMHFESSLQDFKSPDMVTFRAFVIPYILPQTFRVCATPYTFPYLTHTSIVLLKYPYIPRETTSFYGTQHVPRVPACPTLLYINSQIAMYQQAIVIKVVRHFFFFLKFITVHFEESTCKVKKISRVYLVMSHIVFRRMVSSRTQPKCLIFSKHHMKFTPLFISFYSFLYKKNPSV